MSQLLQLLYDVKAGITRFIQLLREPVDGLNKNAIQTIVGPITSALNDILQSTNNAPIAQDLSKTTRQTLAACVNIVKIIQQGGDLETAQIELQDVGTQFNIVCREFTEFAQKQHGINTLNTQSDYNFNLNSYNPGEIIYVQSPSEYDFLLRIRETPVVVCVSCDGTQYRHVEDLFRLIAGQNDHAKFLYVDLEMFQGVIPSISNVSVVPTIRFYLNGKITEELVGLSDKKTFQIAITKHVSRPKSQFSTQAVDPSPSKNQTFTTQSWDPSPSKGQPSTQGGDPPPSIRFGAVNYVDSLHPTLAAIRDHFVIVNISNNSPCCTTSKSLCEELARLNTKIAFVYINIENSREFRDVQVNQLPLYHIYLNSQKVRELTNPSDSFLRSTVAQLIPHGREKIKGPSTVAPAIVPKPPADFNFVPFAGVDKGRILEIHSAEEYREHMVDRGRPLVVNISINSPVCMAMTNLYRELAENNAHGDFLLLDLHELKGKIPEISNVEKVPFFRFYKDGKMVKDFGGQFQEDTLRAAVNIHVTKYKPKPTSSGIASTGGLHTPGKVLNLTTEDAYKALLASPDTLVIVNFFNHEKISQDMRPIFSQLASERLSAVFAQVDVNVCKNTIRACSAAMRLPCFRFFKNCDRLKEWMGNSPEYLRGLVEKFDK